jgi:hypothetical protein
LAASDQGQGARYLEFEVETDDATALELDMDTTALELETDAALLELETDATHLELETDVTPLELKMETDVSHEISK